MPTRFAKFASLDWATRWLLFRALILVTWARLVVWLVPFERLRIVPVVKEKQTFDPRQTAWAIIAASQFIPKATCLVQALAAQKLIASHGFVSRIRIGVAKHEGKFLAHAWLESEGEIILGESIGLAYTPIVTFSAEKLA